MSRATLPVTFDSAAELKTLLSNRKDLGALEKALGILVQQLHLATKVTDTEDPEFVHLAGLVFRYFEGSQAATAEVMNLWEISLKVDTDSPLVLLMLRTLSCLMRVLTRRPAFVPFAAKLAKDTWTEQTKFIYRCLTSNMMAPVSCALDLLAAMASVDASCAELLCTDVDFTLRALGGFPTNRRKTKFDPATGEETDPRSCFVAFILALLRMGNYGVRLAVLKMNNFMTPILAGLPADDPDRVLVLLDTLEKSVLAEESGAKSTKGLVIALLTIANTASLVRLFEYRNPLVQQRISQLMTHVSDRHAATNVVFRVDHLEADAFACLRNKILLNVLCNLKVFESVEQLQLALRIMEECPDVVGPYLGEARLDFEPEATVRWITHCSMLTRVVDFRPSPDTQIDKTQPIDFLLTAVCPSRAALTRAMLHDSPLVQLYALQLQLALLRRLFWILELIEQEMAGCDEGVYGLAESTRRMRLLGPASEATLAAAERHLPDIQTIQGILVALLSPRPVPIQTKKTKDEADKPDELTRLLPADWETQLTALALDSLQYHVRVFVSHADSLAQAQFEDPVKLLRPLFSVDTALSPALALPVLRLAAAFPRIVAKDVESGSDGAKVHVSAWVSFFAFVGAAMRDSSAVETTRLAHHVFGSVLYSTGLFIDTPGEIEWMAEWVRDGRLSPVHLERILRDGWMVSSQTLVHARSSSECSPLIALWLNADDKQLRRLAKHIVKAHGKGKKPPGFPVTATATATKAPVSREIPVKRKLIEADSDDDSETSDDDAESRAKTRAETRTVRESNAAFEPLDPDTTAPGILFAQLLGQVDRERFLQLTLHFPVERALIVPPRRQRVSAALLRELLYDDSDDFVVFCNWLSVLKHFLEAVPVGELDGHVLVWSHVLSAVVMGLASRDIAMRRVAGHVLALVLGHVAPPGDRRLLQVYSLLAHLSRGLVPEHERDDPGALIVPPPVALYHALALPVLLQPEHVMYHAICHAMHQSLAAKLRVLPLFDTLVRAVDLDVDTMLPERAVFTRQLPWLLRCVEFGCRDVNDVLQGPLRRSRVLETLLSLLPIMLVTPNSAASVRVMGAVLRLFRRLSQLDASVRDTLNAEFGLEQWLVFVADRVRGLSCDALAPIRSLLADVGSVEGSAGR